MTVHTPEYVRLLHTRLLHVEQEQNNPTFVYFNFSYRLMLLFMFWLMRK